MVLPVVVKWGREGREEDRNKLCIGWHGGGVGEGDILKVMYSLMQES